MPSIEAFLREMVERGASDLHMTTQSPPMIRLHGELTPIAHPPLTARRRDGDGRSTQVVDESIHPSAISTWLAV